MIEFVQGLPEGIYVGQTQRTYLQSLTACVSELEGFNLALHVGDENVRVHTHRMALMSLLSQYNVHKMTWLEQTHSTLCHVVNESSSNLLPLVGDGLVTQQQNHALMIMTADCLPIVFGNNEEIANVHAGWRGLVEGIVENTINQMNNPPMWAWLGACISQNCFEVGLGVKDVFCQKYNVEFAFKTKENPDKTYADLYAIAKYILQSYGVKHILGGEACTFTESDKYFSYRRQAKTGRMATFAFMNK